MKLTYKACKSLIKNEKYESKEDLQEKLDVFYLGERLTKEEYEELTSLLNNK